MAQIDFGLVLQPTPRGFPPSELPDYNVRLVAALPNIFTTLWVEDHLQWDSLPTLECLSTAAFYLGTFPRFHVGTLVASQSFRNPGLLAKTAATLQLLSEGRFILGLGAGWKKDEYDAFGVPFPPHSVRIEQLDEYLQVVRLLWSEGASTFQGVHYRITRAYCEPVPAPPVPILIGGGSTSLLSIAARHADWWNLHFCSPERYRERVRVLFAICDRVRRDPSSLRLTHYATVSVARNDASALRHPTVHFIAGSPSSVIRELSAFVALGVTHFMLRFADLNTLELFVSLVLPEFA